MLLVSLYLLLPFLALLLVNVPVTISLGLSSAIFLLFSGTRLPPLLIVSEMYDSVAKFALLALPMYVLAGELLNRFDFTIKLINVAKLMVGWLRGGLAHVHIVTSMIFSGISGSIFGDLASIGSIMIPAMIRERYPRDFAAAVTAAAALIGGIIPPSTVMIIIGAHLNISIGGLFAAGIVPGILVGVAMMVVAWFISARYKYGEIHPVPDARTAVWTVLASLPVLTIPVFLILGIVGGAFTPTEAGAAAVAYSIVLGFLYRRLSARLLWDSLVSTVYVTASSLVIVATAFIFSRILTFHKIPQELLNVLLALSDSPVMIVLLMTLVLLIVGTFMDALANMIILGPLLMPVMVDGAGMHPIQFGIWLMIGLLLGLLTPPLGMCLFMVAPMAKTSLARVSYTVLPFLAAQLVVLLLLAFVPWITLALPRWAGFI